MMLRDVVDLAILNLKRMKLRVAMTAGGVLIGTAAVVLLVSLGVGLQRSAQQSLGDLGNLTLLTVMPSAGPGPQPGPASPQGRQTTLTPDVLEEFARMPGVTGVTPVVPLSGNATFKVGDWVGFANVFGIDPRAIKGLDLELEDGKAFLNRGNVLLGAQVLRTLRNPRRPMERPGSRGASEKEKVKLVGKSIVLTITGRPIPRMEGPGIVVEMPRGAEQREKRLRVRVAGVLKPMGFTLDMAIVLPLDEVLRLERELTGRTPTYARRGYPQALVKVADVKQAVKVEQELTRRGYIVISPRTMMQGMNVFFAILQGILGGIGAVALLVAAFGIANTMVMAIYERTREIGLLKAMGATNRDIMSLFLMESGAIGFLGGLGGVVLGYLVGWVGNQVVSAYIQRNLVMQGMQPTNDSMATTFVYTPLWLVVFALAFSFLIGIMSGIYPAVRAANLDPVQALRYE